MNSKVNLFINRAKKWGDELAILRSIILESELTEELKWYQPCYTFQNKNVILLGGFKDYCVISFLKGALLTDSYNLLCKPGENTQSARVIRFTNTQDIISKKAILKAYINETIELEKSGRSVSFLKVTERTIPDELQNKYDEISELKIAFEALTPGRQRAYLLYFSAPKQAKTRESRIEKCMAQILDGKGLND